MVSLTKLERINFFDGRLLTVDNFRQEQSYYRGQHRRHNQWLHGAGIVYGLNVSVISNKTNTVQVEPGLAYDCLGNEICVPEPVPLKLPKSRNPIYLCVKYCEQEIDLIPVLIEVSRLKDSMVANRIEESFDFTFESSDPFARHKRQLRGWLACGESHALPLARLRSTQKLTLDHRFVVPRMK